MFLGKTVCKTHLQISRADWVQHMSTEHYVRPRNKWANVFKSLAKVQQSLACKKALFLDLAYYCFRTIAYCFLRNCLCFLMYKVVSHMRDSTALNYDPVSRIQQETIDTELRSSDFSNCDGI